MKKQNLKSKISNVKGNKGITLVALIITIIVLLILAVVAINAVNNTGIIQYAQNSADEYADGRDKENTVLGSYLETLKEHEPGGNSEENPGGAGDGEQEDDDVVITSEKDLTVAMYQYNTMYNPNQPEIVSASGYYDDENNDRISDKNSSLGAYIDDSYFNIPVSFFTTAIPTEGNIEATITHYDGTEENITLATTDNKAWIYESEGSSLIGIDKTYIGFRPFAKYYDVTHRDGIDDYEESSEYHYIYIKGEVAVPFYKIQMLGRTIEFPFNCQAQIVCGDIETNVIEPMYNNIDNVSKITVNFSDGTNKVYTEEKIFDINSYIGLYPYSSQEVPILYGDGAFVIKMPEAGLKTQITSVIVEENGIATKYNVSDSTMVVHTRPAS